MSHNYPYRRAQPDSSLRSDPGSYSSSDRRHASPDRQFYQAPQESFSTSYPSSSSSRVTTWTKEGAVNILSSCGLKPSDLALLAEMPEDSLTVESLPRVLQQIKGKRGTVKQYPPSSSYTPGSDLRPPASPTASSWERPHSQQLKYQADPVSSSAELDRWGNPIVFSSVRPDRTAPSSSPSSSSPSYTVDFHHRQTASDYGKNSRDAGSASSKDYNHKPGSSDFIRPGRDSRQLSSQDYHHRAGPPESGRSARDSNPAISQDYDYRSPDFSRTTRDLDPVFPQSWSSFSSAGPDKTSRQTHHSQPGPADHRPPPQESRHKPLWGSSSSEASTTRTRTSSSSQPAGTVPSVQNALDFHGSTPPSFPYSCSLCAITVMSEKVWLKHINGPLHADGQLNLLQQFPGWDCRLETVGRADNQSERRKDDRKPPEKSPSSSHSSNSSQQKKNPQKKSSEKSKVVCAKFAAHSVDEAHLKKLAEPFGRVVKILMFPSLAFVELGSMDQAKDMVNYYCSNPPTVSGEQMEFRISNTFNFLQSSCVVSFIPAPAGEDSRADLISIVKRFGSPLYTLFLPSKAFVEMKDTSEAQKLVNYYSSNSLKINNELLKVSFSGEYKSLMRISSAKKYQEDTSRTRSPSKERDVRRTESRRRRSSRDRDDGRTRHRSRSRSRSRERSNKERKTRTRSKSRDRASHGRKSESEESSRTESRSKSESESREKSVREEETEASESSPDPGPVQGSRPAESHPTEEEALWSADNSDIEGMEVIGEDGEDLHQEEMEVLDDTDGEEGVERTEEQQGDLQEEEHSAETERPAEKPDSPGGDGEADGAEEENQETNHQEEREEGAEASVSVEEMMQSRHDEDEPEPDYPLDLDSCITLDELEDEECDHPDEEVRGQPTDPQSSGCRVLYFRNIPLDSLSDSEFVGLVKDHGKAVRFFRIHDRRTGFLEMASSAEADRVLKAMTIKPVYVNGCRVHVQLSYSYNRLTTGWTVGDDHRRDESQSQGSRRSRKSSERDESRSSRRSEERESRSSRRRCLEKESMSRRSSERSSEKKTPEKNVRTTQRTEPADKKTKENESAASSEKGSETMKSTEDKQTEETNPDHQESEELSAPQHQEDTKVQQGEPERSSRRTQGKESADQKTKETDLVDIKSTEDMQTEESEKLSAPQMDQHEEDNQDKDRKVQEEEPEDSPRTLGESMSRESEEKEPGTSRRRSARKEPASAEASGVSSEELSPQKTSRPGPESESVDDKTEENESKMEEEDSRRPPETELESRQKTSADPDSNQTPEKNQAPSTRGRRTTKRKGARRARSVPEKRERRSESRDESESAEVPPQEKSETAEAAVKDSGSPHRSDQSREPPKAEGQSPMEQDHGPEGGAAEPQKPTRPVGTEFVRPVVGYFCNLCQLIYVDEDKAKQEHCSSLEHYRRYQEKTGNDPWTS